MSININIFHSIHEAVDNIDNDYFFYQDVTVQHPYNLLTFVEKHMDKEYDFIGINKETIRYNVLPDILYCKKESYISKHMKFELQILYTYYYKIVGLTNIIHNKIDKPHGSVKNIIISSTQYPGYGGAATNAYELIKFFRKQGFNVCGVFFGRNLPDNCDPDNISGIFSCSYGEEYAMKSKHIIKQVADYFNGKPDICLAKNYMAPLFCKRLFKCYTVYLVSGINHFRLFFPEKTALEVLNKNFIINPKQVNKNEKKTNEICDKIVCNSSLTKSIFTKIYPEWKEKIGKVIDTTCISKNVNMESINKEYDISIICSNLTRKCKNNEFLIPILMNPVFNKYKKIIVGNNYEKFKLIPNSICTGLLSHNETIKIMSKSKILLFPSFFDSNPNTVREAYNHKCIPIITKNIGYSELFPTYLICDGYSNNEWANKILNTITYYDYIQHIKIDYQKTISIYDFLTLLLFQ